MSTKKSVNEKMREQAVAAYVAGESALKIALRFGVSDSAVYNWIKHGTGVGAQSLLNTNRKNKRQKAVSDKSTLREALYNQVADEYKVKEQELEILHKKLKFLGEDWNADTIQ